MGKKEERLNHLIETVKKKNGTTVKELSSVLKVSEMTVRRDLEFLKYSDVLINVNGAILYNSKSSLQEADSGYLLSLATAANVKEKTKIGQCAASLLEEGDCIIIDNGSTTEILAGCIDKEIRLTILTCNLNILNKITSNANASIMFGGGYYHADTSLFESPESISLIKKTRATKVFVSAAGIHEELGVTCMNSYELETKRAIIKSGAVKILLLDSSKFGKVTPCFFAEITDFNMIITDQNISEEWIHKIEEKGIKLIIA